MENYPDVRTRVEHHLEETLGQQALLEGCLTRHVSGPSLIKGMTGELVAFGRAVGGMAMRDEVVKGVMSGYVFEHKEIAAYTALIVAAHAAGDMETSRICEQVLSQEVEMTRWLLAHLPNTVTAYLAHSSDGRDDAKR